MNEIWKDVLGFERFYRVSNSGNVFSIRRNRIMKPSDNGLGYLILMLQGGGKKESWLLHRLVALHFIPNGNAINEVNHLDGNKYNCAASNLEWCTHKENVRHSIDVLGFNPKMINKDKVGALNWNSKAVNQYDKQGNLINSFGSTTEAFRNTGIDFSSIQKVCLGKRSSAGGYRWVYSSQD